MTSLINKMKWGYIRNNLQSCIFTIVYTLVSLFLFFYRLWEYWEITVALAIARASAFVIYFQSITIVILVLRKSITFFRSYGLAHYLPLDHYVYFHKITGWSIAFFSLLHTLAHLYNFNALYQLVLIPYWELLFSTSPGIGMFGSACLTGWALIVVLIIIMSLSTNYIRRTGKFELFYYSHKLYLLYFILTVFHAKYGFRCLLVPCLLLFIEKLSSIIKINKDQHGLTYALEGVLLPSRVLRLAIKKPKYLTFNPGDFVYVMIPLITQYEWHPITISSAPEDEEITIHIRAVGEWTNRIYEHFEHAKSLSLKRMLDEWSQKCVDNHPRLNKETSAEAKTCEENCAVNTSNIYKKTMILPIPEDCDENGCGKPKKSSTLSKSSRQSFKSDKDCIELEDVKQNNNHDCDDESNEDIDDSYIGKLEKNIQSNQVYLVEPLKICLDGPYGAPSSHIFHSEHAVLVATGIGVTPFASILQSIMYRHTEKIRHCPKCAHSWSERVPSQRIMSLKKVDFVWINRDQTSFEWFVELLSDLNNQQFAITGPNDNERFMEFHMYVTGKEVPQNKRNSSVIEKYKNSLNWKFGRPNWQEFFDNIRDENRGRVTVFYCGRPDLGSFLRNHCSQYNFRFKKEVF